MKKALTTVGTLLLLLTISYTTMQQHKKLPVPLEIKESPVNPIDSVWPPPPLPQRVWPLPYYDAVPLESKEFIA